MASSTLKKQLNQKNKLIEKTLGLVKRSSSNSDYPVKGFMRNFCLQIPPEDIALWESSDLNNAVQSLLSLAGNRIVGTPKLRIYNPEIKKHGWHVNRSVVEIVNNDMPFLIDSISAELLNNNQVIEVLLHPILNIKRDPKGKLTDVKDTAGKAKGCLHESYIHIQLENILSETECDLLEARLLNVVKDVRLATTDWRKMLVQAEGVIRELAAAPVKAGAEEVSEAQEFLQYAYDNNFTFLGYRRDDVKMKENKPCLVKTQGSELGLLSKSQNIIDSEFQSAKELETLKKSPSPVVISKLINQYSSVHRRVPFDAIFIKILNEKNEMIGRHTFIGLFTSSTYSCRTIEVPIVRQKVKETLSKASFGHDSHDHKALEHILEKYPRDELFQVGVDELVETSLGILRLQERNRTALFTREDSLGKYMSCLVYVPRDLFDSRFRRKVAVILEEELNGKLTNFFTTLDDSPLARVLFTISYNEDVTRKYDVDAIEKKLVNVSRGWDDSLKQSLVEQRGKEEAFKAFDIYQGAFSQAYKDNKSGDGAFYDIEQIENLTDTSNIGVELYKLKDSKDYEYRLKVYHDKTPVPLSDILPILERMGLRVISELPFQVKPNDREEAVWIHDFALETENEKAFDLNAIKPAFEDAFLHVWRKEAENDGLNALVLKGGTWRQINIMRMFMNFMRQIKFPYSSRYVQSVLTSYPEISSDLVDLFLIKNDPKHKKSYLKDYDYKKSDILNKLEGVSQLDHDRILRAIITLLDNTLRTNYFQKNEDGTLKSWLSVKIQSRDVSFIPKPRPFVEIYIYSPRVEAVHLRGGMIARGGMRWSDRHDDFRTEVLGLVKAQNVKNAVIVPVGSKGGFVVKQSPKTGGRDAFFAEGIACYKIMIQAMLDLTDNLKKNKVIKPKDVVCHDGDDPYLVVAADKGTATFSDIANGISLENDFWLGDAFASGGSAGYDHKAMGITARGAWESVKRHFREMGVNIQKEDFTCIGVGDMGGDVFGNGLLLSKHTKLIAAFNHLHIFCDPNPDTAKSFKERQRLFKERGGWDKYKTELISKGGRVYKRSDKVLKLTKQIRDCFGIEETEVTPNDLMRYILKSKTDLLWFGGIGTYVKSSHESNADADDRANDAMRINGRDLNAKVIGEGANLGMTQKGRIEFAQQGGRLNTDFIDNSAGVDCSDHEVNIKILLSEVMQNQNMNLKQRDTLLEKMTDQVGELVLKDNYQQSQALSMCQYEGRELMARYASYMRDLETAGKLDRVVENLPDDETLDRMVLNGDVLTRPEFAVILCYSKIEFYKNLLESDLPQEAGSLNWLYEYFPDNLKKYNKEIESHKLKHEIISTNITNTLINRMGPLFIQSRIDKTGALGANVARAFIIAVESFGARELWDEIEALDNKIPADVQYDALFEVFSLVKRVVTWILRHEANQIDVKYYVDLLKSGVETFLNNIDEVLPSHLRGRADLIEKEFKADGLPVKLAKKLSYLRILVSSCDILKIKETCNARIQDIARTYFEVGQRLQIDRLREEVRLSTSENHWEARVLGSLNDDLYTYQAEITSNIVEKYGCPNGTGTKLLEWVEDHTSDISIMDGLLQEIWHAPSRNPSMLILAGQRLRQLTDDQAKPKS